MAFTKANQKIMTEKDLAFVKSLYENLFGEFRKDLERRVESRREIFGPIKEAFDRSYGEFMARFEELSRSEGKVSLDEFYDSQMKKIHDSIKGAAPLMTDTAWRNFAEGPFSAFLERYSGAVPERDTLKGLGISMGSFKLATEPFPGIENLAPYDPYRTKIDALSESRKANSGTYVEARNPEDQRTKNALYGYNSATEYSRMAAGDFMSKKEVTAGELFETFSSINTLLRTNPERGGKLRLETATAGVIISISSVALPEQAYKLMDSLAEKINLIKQTSDPMLQKSQAIQLAAFAYQLSISEHIFEDGNGRSCRMLADTILGTFGLPPHTPHIALASTGATIGTPLNYERGANLIFKGVQVSDEIMKLEQTHDAENLDGRAQELLKEQGANIKVPGDVGPRKAINMAMQAREGKMEMVEALKDLIAADHFGTRNSKEYKAVISAGKECIKAFTEGDLNTGNAMKSYELLHRTIMAYQKHCDASPKSNPTRIARLDSISRLSTAALSVKALGSFEAKLNKSTIEEERQRVQAQVLDSVRPGDINTRKHLAEYFITRMIENDMKLRQPRYGQDQYKKMLQLDERLVDKIMTDPDMTAALDYCAANGKLTGKGVKEQFEAVSDRYEHLKVLEVDQKEKQAKEEGKTIVADFSFTPAL